MAGIKRPSRTLLTYIQIFGNDSGLYSESIKTAILCVPEWSYQNFDAIFLKK